eukprot:Sspe_Gene.27014::Locus_11441_Transcript_1_1_Confidence_1.000_Length_1162::g.27014::m.27014
MNRYCWAAQCCLSVTGKVHRTELLLAGTLGVGGIADIVNKPFFNNVRRGEATRYVNATCVPLPTLLERTNGGKIADFWVLDVEGAEALILQSTPPSAKVVLVEHNTIEANRKAIYDTLRAAGYYRFLAERLDDWCS